MSFDEMPLVKYLAKIVSFSANHSTNGSFVERILRMIPT